MTRKLKVFSVVLLSNLFEEFVEWLFWKTPVSRTLVSIKKNVRTLPPPSTCQPLTYDNIHINEIRTTMDKTAFVINFQWSVSPEPHTDYNRSKAAVMRAKVSNHGSATSCCEQNYAKLTLPAVELLAGKKQAEPLEVEELPKLLKCPSQLLVAQCSSSDWKTTYRSVRICHSLNVPDVRF